jgi:hypothetical protein
MQSRGFRVRAACGLCWLGATGALGGFTGLLNGEFSDDLVGWTATGNVFVQSGEAVIGELGVTRSRLYQGVALPAGEGSVEFDLLPDLSDTVQGGALFDTFFASLYFVDDLSTFDLELGIYDAQVPLMDLDAFGPFNVAGSLEPSVLGGDWIHFQAEFLSSYTHVVLAFELVDQNGLEADSRVRVDNLALIPEPAVIYLLGLGLLLLRRKT